MKQVALGELWLPEARAAAFACELLQLTSLLGAEFWAARGVLNGSKTVEFWVGPHGGCWQSPSGGCWDAGSLHSGGWCAQVRLQPHGDHQYRWAWGLGVRRGVIPELGTLSILWEGVRVGGNLEEPETWP